MFTSEPKADSPTRQKQAQLILRLSKQLNKLDSTFQLPVGPYTFEYELRAKVIMEAAYEASLSSSSTANQPRDIIPPSSGAVQERPGQGSTGGPRDAVIDIPLRVDSEKAHASGGDVDDSEAVVGAGDEQPEIT